MRARENCSETMKSYYGESTGYKCYKKTWVQPWKLFPACYSSPSHNKPATDSVLSSGRKIKHLGFDWFPAAGLHPMSPSSDCVTFWDASCPRMFFRHKVLMRQSFTSLWGNSFLFCRHTGKDKGIKWVYTSSRCQSLVHLLPLPCSVQLWNFLLLIKSRVHTNYLRLLLFSVHTAVSHPQGEEISDLQLKHVLKRTFCKFTLSETLIYV